MANCDCVTAKAEKATEPSPSPRSKERRPSASGGRTKAESRKRKSNEVPHKEEKCGNKNVPKVKKLDNKLNQVGKTAESVFEDNPKTMTSPEKSKKENKNSADTLEEEMKQRRAERDSPRKSSRGLDKLLEKRVHLDKLSRTKELEEQEHVSSSFLIYFTVA